MMPPMGVQRGCSPRRALASELRQLSSASSCTVGPARAMRHDARRCASPCSCSHGLVLPVAAGLTHICCFCCKGSDVEEGHTIVVCRRKNDTRDLQGRSPDGKLRKGANEVGGAVADPMGVEIEMGSRTEKCDEAENRVTETELWDTCE